MAGFHDVIGHEKTIDRLKSAIRNDRVSHAYLFVGDAGSGKKTLARAFAQALQCQSRTEDGDACGTCASCVRSAGGNHPDLITWKHEKAATFTVDDARRLSEHVWLRPFESERKVYIVPECERMNAEAQNALLKTLEEPPEYAHLLLLTTSSDILLETVRSRCVMLDLKPVTGEQVRQYLVSELGLDGQEADICEAFAQGNIGRAKNLASSQDFTHMLESVLNILDHVKDWELPEILAAVNELVPYKVTIEDLLDLFTVWYRDVLFFKATRDADGIVFRDRISNVRGAAQQSSYEGVMTVLDAIKTASVRLRANVSFELTMELLLLTMKEN